MIDEDGVFARLAGTTAAPDLSDQHRLISGFFCRCLMLLEPGLGDFMRSTLGLATRYWIEGSGDPAAIRRARIECWERFAELSEEEISSHAETKLRLLVGVLFDESPTRAELLEGVEWSLEWLNELGADATKVEEILESMVPAH